MFFLIYLEIVKVDEGHLFSAFCGHLPTSPKLVILSAVYQVKNNPLSESTDVTNLVRKLCGTDTSCVLLINNEVLESDLCLKCPKELYVTYTCSNRKRKLSMML